MFFCETARNGSSSYDTNACILSALLYSVQQGKSHSLTLHQGVLPPSAITLHIQGFEKVTITPETFAADNLTLRDIHFEDIGEVELQNGSLHFSSKAP